MSEKDLHNDSDSDIWGPDDMIGDGVLDDFCMIIIIYSNHCLFWRDSVRPRVGEQLEPWAWGGVPHRGSQTREPGLSVCNGRLQITFILDHPPAERAPFSIFSVRTRPPTTDANRARFIGRFTAHSQGEFSRETPRSGGQFKVRAGRGR